jgi:hypothetical protein
MKDAELDDRGTYMKWEVHDSGSYRVLLLIKCKAIPLQAWTGPDGTRRMRLPDCKTIGT